ncbi:hypothetical protein F53441_10340 [Fusarium austroafricanum]|uniref:Uncharacterized protein n=1 Tax=Fusarium austroafricanum TaxID=2364996 RepID=A0A8H4P2D2_9HYPO|nr:hypothetical protein F53441_10340 [Fusarium austroafricanum]
MSERISATGNGDSFCTEASSALIRHAGFDQERQRAQAFVDDLKYFIVGLQTLSRRFRRNAEIGRDILDLSLSMSHKATEMELVLPNLNSAHNLVQINLGYIEGCATPGVR